MSGEGRGRLDRIRTAVAAAERAGALRRDSQMYSPGDRGRVWLLTVTSPEEGSGGWWMSERALGTFEAECLLNGIAAGLSAAANSVRALGDFPLSALLAETEEGSALAGLAPGCPQGDRLAARAEDERAALALLNLPAPEPEAGEGDYWRRVAALREEAE